MIAFMAKTIGTINEDLKAGKTVIVTVVEDRGTDMSQSSDVLVDAVTTATFENSYHRIPYGLPSAKKK